MLKLLRKIQQQLLELHHPAIFEPNRYVKAWFKPEVCSTFLQHATVIRPHRIKYHIGLAFMCHENSFRYAFENQSGHPYLGFRLFDDGDDVLRWCVHSFVLEHDGTVVDSGGLIPPGAPAVFYGMPWTVRLVEVCPKLPKSQTEIINGDCIRQCHPPDQSSTVDRKDLDQGT